MLKIFAMCLLMFSFASCQRSCGMGRDKETLVIGTNATFMPYEFVNDKGELEGFDIDLGHAIGRVLKRSVIFKEFDFDALILALKKGQADLIISALSVTSSRQKEIAMIPYQGEPITQVSFLSWKNIYDIKNFAELNNKCSEKKSEISVQAGHFLEDFLKEQNIPLKPLPGPPEQVLDIKYGKSLFAAVDPPNAQKLSSLHSELKIFSLDLPEDRWDLGYGIGIKKSENKLILDIKEAISKLKADGTIKSLEDKWLKVK